ncbi:hypothetical protein DMA11_12405 [Marinilabiliaceae bacterium JC017]|nr:hypothetical protein DMA11_12405 [Marinilabiliaceae bacterium JC017]
MNYSRDSEGFIGDDTHRCLAICLHNEYCPLKVSTAGATVQDMRQGAQWQPTGLGANVEWRAEATKEPTYRLTEHSSQGWRYNGAPARPP